MQPGSGTLQRTRGYSTEFGGISSGARFRIGNPEYIQGAFDIGRNYPAWFDANARFPKGGERTMKFNPMLGN